MSYVDYQLAKALTTSQTHEDPATRQRAEEKVKKWTAVFINMLDGSLKVGSRTPLDGVPAWVTLEVVTGGFATGGFLAGGELHPHETNKLTQLASDWVRNTTLTDRARLNSYYLTEAGLAELQEILHTQQYEIQVPEEGALLVVAWLAENGHGEAARELLDELQPHFTDLRFYPIPTDKPRQFGSRVSLQTVAEVVAVLRAIKPNQKILTQKEAIQVWIPLYDKMVTLFLQTVEGSPPDLKRDEQGNPLPRVDGRFPVVGGWPCQTYPDGWFEQAETLLNRYEQLRRKHQRAGKPERMKDSFAQLRLYLTMILDNPQSLTGRDVGRIRLILARYIAKRGLPQSATWQAARQRQRQQASSPLFADIAHVVGQRLEGHPPNQGIADVETVLQPVTRKEGQARRIRTGTPIPASQQRKVRRGAEDEIENLVAQGIITSGETLAHILPKLTAAIQANSIADPSLSHLYAALYQAFRRRRSLLLLNLESQVKFAELPWVTAVDPFIHHDLATRQLAQETLEEIIRLTLLSFPQTIIPNKLMKELYALARQADLAIPLVDEIAADIFMGTFSNKFVQAAKCAARLLQGTLYARYYDIDYASVLTLPEIEDKPGWYAGRARDDKFAQLCAARVGVQKSGSYVSRNGMIIEQQQIMTTHNLAALFTYLDLSSLRQPEVLRQMAQDCFRWLCRRQQVKSDDWHTKLIMLKNTAYAWRQMIFFLALLPHEEVSLFLLWASEHLQAQTPAFQKRFQPVLRGLQFAHDPTNSRDDLRAQLAEIRFLGWSATRHWLMD